MVKLIKGGSLGSIRLPVLNDMGRGIYHTQADRLQPTASVLISNTYTIRGGNTDEKDAEEHADDGGYICGNGGSCLAAEEVALRSHTGLGPQAADTAEFDCSALGDQKKPRPALKKAVRLFMYMSGQKSD
ncbi:hypothetical protein [Paenibacillus sp. 1P03SA]|uniref:hypothetical protein n=1 Tax=Paenibacillus sp. 1P03SA TaxID=3132294 RepID=UPI00399EF2E8